MFSYIPHRMEIYLVPHTYNTKSNKHTNCLEANVVSCIRFTNDTMYGPIAIGDMDHVTIEIINVINFNW